MANRDDVNSSSRPVNGSARRSDDFSLPELTRIGEQLNHLPQEQRDYLQRIRTYEDNLSNYGGQYVQQRAEYLDVLRDMRNDALDRIRSNPQDSRASAELKRYKQEIRDREKEERAYRDALEHLPNVRAKVDQFNESRAVRLNKQAVNAVERELAPGRINTYVAEHSNNEIAQAKGLNLASQYSYTELSKQRDALWEAIESRRQDSIYLAKEVANSPEEFQQTSGAIFENATTIGSLARGLPFVEAGMRHLKNLGKDPQSRQLWMAKMGEQARSSLAFQQLQQTISKGEGDYGNLTASDLKKKETEAAENLIKALNKLADSADESEEAIAKLTQEADQAAEKYEEVQEAGRAGAGGRSDNLQLGMIYSSAVARAAQTAGNYIQVMGINQPMANMANVSGFANIENQKHDSWRSAIAGDMTERLNLSGWGLATQFGANRAGYAKAKNIADIVGGIGATGAGALQLTQALTNAPGGAITGLVTGNADTAQNVANGVIATEEGALMLASSIKDAVQHTSQGQARIAGVNATMGAARQINHIPGFQLQQYRNHMEALYSPSMSMGSRREGFLNYTGGAYFLDQMQQYGLGSGEFGSMAKWGAENIGSMFNADNVLQAKRFENLGFGTAEANMQRMGALSLGGTQNPSESLEKMLERAMSVGLDSSKALSMIAENTGSMAEKSAMSGIENTGEQFNRQIISAIDGNSPNQELATKRALNAIQFNEQARNNRGANFHGMMAVSRLMKDFGVSFETGNALQGLNVAQLRTIMNGGNIENDLLGRGINTDEIRGDKREFLRGVIERKLLSNAEYGGGMASGANTGWLKIKQWIGGDRGRANTLADGKYNMLPDDVRDAARKMFFTWQASGQDPQANMREMLGTAGMISGGKGTLGDGTIDSTAFTTFGDYIREFTRGNRQNAKAAGHVLESQGLLSGADGGAFIAGSGDIAQNRGPSEAKWETAAAESAKSFGESAIKLNGAAGKLEKAAEALLKAARIKELAGMTGLADRELNSGDRTVLENMRRLDEAGIEPVRD